MSHGEEGEPKVSAILGYWALEVLHLLNLQETGAPAQVEGRGYMLLQGLLT